MNNCSNQRAVFLDRDGVINEILFFEDLGILETPFHPKHLKLLPHVPKAIKRLNRAGFKVLVVSNQPGVGMGHFSEEMLLKINHKMLNLIEKQGARIDGVFYCLHHPEKGRGIYRKKCRCRKPKPGLLDLAKKEFNVNLAQSYLIGDSISDVQAGRARKVKTILLGRRKCDLCDLMSRKGIKPNWMAKNLLEAVRQIERLEK
ncbi:MAG: HAD family hydrolase [Candidatus Omnitrophica bacterium]|nr:HAD family hydrolase [Candidatus Omnitrophota bacterium]